MPKKNQNIEFRAVHWFSNDEWKKVYHLIFGVDSDDNSKREALQILFMWKMRNPYIPSGIESTLGLLEVDLQCCKDDSAHVVPERLLRLMYSTAIMRFINHTLDDAQSKKFTLLQAAKHLDIPQWIIDLRHETAHGHELPSLNMLQEAANFSLNWLYKAYWKPKYDQLSDHFINNKDNFVDDFLALFQLHNSLVALQYPVFNVSRFCDISDKEVRKDLFKDLKDALKHNNININDSFSEIHKILINTIEKFLITNMNNTCHSNALCDILVDENSFFMTGNITDNEHIFEELDDKCLKLWEPLLTVLHTQNIIGSLLIGLIKITSNTSSKIKQKEAATQWIKKIAFGLNKSALAKKIYFDQNFENNDALKEYLLQILIKRYPSQKKGMIFNILQPVPSELTSLNFIHDVFLKPNPYLQLYLDELLELLEPKLHIHTRHKLVNLLHIMVGSNSCNVSNNNTIYTVDDVKLLSVNDTDANHDVVMEDLAIQNNSIWRKSSQAYDWGSCPIGLLPWQNPKTFSFI